MAGVKIDATRKAVIVAKYGYGGGGKPIDDTEPDQDRCRWRDAHRGYGCDRRHRPVLDEEAL